MKNGRWTYWLPAVGALGAWWQALQTYHTGHIPERCARRSDAICHYGPQLGAVLFGDDQGYWGYSLLMIILGCLMLALSVFLLWRTSRGKNVDD